MLGKSHYSNCVTAITNMRPLNAHKPQNGVKSDLFMKQNNLTLMFIENVYLTTQYTKKIYILCIANSLSKKKRRTSWKANMKEHKCQTD